MKLSLSFLLFFTLTFSDGFVVQSQENWTHLRGNQLDGHSVSKQAPVSWSETNTILWKTEIRGIAWSSPVVFGDQIWTSSATRSGDEMFAVCTDFASGKIVKEVMLLNLIRFSICTRQIVMPLQLPALKTVLFTCISELMALPVLTPEVLKLYGLVPT